MAGMVIDASLAIAWVSPGHASSPTDALLTDVGLGTPIFAPALWPIPVANALLVLERRKKLRTEERLAALGALRGLNGSIDHEMSALAYTEVSDIASQLAMNVYDAVYLELALRLKIPLASTDDALRAAAKRRRVKLLPLARTRCDAHGWASVSSPTMDLSALMCVLTRTP